jgi:hypothetical protein
MTSEEFGRLSSAIEKTLGQVFALEKDIQELRMRVGTLELERKALLSRDEISSEDDAISSEDDAIPSEEDNEAAYAFLARAFPDAGGFIRGAAYQGFLEGAARQKKQTEELERLAKEALNGLFRGPDSYDDTLLGELESTLGVPRDWKKQPGHVGRFVNNFETKKMVWSPLDGMHLEDKK